MQKGIGTPMTMNGHLNLNKEDALLIKRYTIPWLDPYYTYAHQGQISCLVCVCVQDSKRHPKSVILWVKRIFRYFVNTPNFGLWYLKGTSFYHVGYSGSDYASDKVGRKSTSGTCMFLGWSLTSWSSMKQNSVYLSNAKTEYISAGSCCAQFLWMTQTLKDYGVHLKHVPLLCDNESAIKIAHNPIQHSQTKHIDVRHHFILDHVSKGDIDPSHVRTDKRLADIFTNLFMRRHFVIWGVSYISLMLLMCIEISLSCLHYGSMLIN